MRKFLLPVHQDGSDGVTAYCPPGSIHCLKVEEIAHNKILTISAGKLVAMTRVVLTFTQCFITAISTVIFAITTPLHRNTMTHRAAKTSLATRLVVTHGFTLIPAVFAVLVSVTQPGGVDARVGVSALGLPWGARHGKTPGLIRKIPAVVVTVAFPLDINAVAIGAGESVCGTCLVIREIKFQNSS